jgi:DNA (cytosine-5)-methyltransferase 1
VKEKKIRHIELFAGCGGMSLGLEAAGYELYFANELSPMAAETFAYNLLNESLEENKNVKNTFWIRSQYPKTEIKQRLRENPFEAFTGNYTDVNGKSDLKGKLLIGDINQLLIILKKNPILVRKIRRENIELLSGGPPCQSFSLAGKREKDNHKNTLPLSFAQIAGIIRPKIVLLENVKGITSPFTENGEKFYAWLEVAKTFALEGYVPICMMLNSKYFGVAQNRPRFILIAYRLDIFDSILKKINVKKDILLKAKSFYVKVRKSTKELNKITIEDLDYYDIDDNPELFDGIIFPKMTTHEGKFITASEAIGDIRKTKVSHKISNVTNGYGEKLNITFSKIDLPENYVIQNHDPREHRFDVKARFRFYQVINEFQNGLKKCASDLFSGKPVEQETLDKLFKEFSNYNLFFKNQNQEEYYKQPKDITEVQNLIKIIPSKKHSQRALKEYEPAPAQLTIPDDLCHYHMENLRTLTVREMARFQSFPDWFEFKSKVTTGGKMRRFEVPQYTQVGNAVPPLLAKALGQAIKDQIKMTE